MLFGGLAETLVGLFLGGGMVHEVTTGKLIFERIRIVSGMRVALDDFGTGFASLTHLLTVPVDIIKIDKSFVDRLVPGDAAIFIVEGLVGIAKNLGIRVVAEGIEATEQAEQLLKMGCLLGQGYPYSKAVDRSAATTLLKQFGQPALAGSDRQKA